MTENEAKNFKAHKKNMRKILSEISRILDMRGFTHDSSRMNNIDETEEEHFVENRHHIEHFENGIQDMNLIDILELSMDWYEHGYDIKEMCLKNHLTKEIYYLIINTIQYYEMFENEEKE